MKAVATLALLVVLVLPATRSSTGKHPSNKETWTPIPVTGTITITRTSSFDKITGTADNKVKLSHHSSITATARITNTSRQEEDGEVFFTHEGQFELNVDLKAEISNEVMVQVEKLTGQSTKAIEELTNFVSVNEQGTKYRINVPAIKGSVKSETSGSIVGQAPITKTKTKQFKVDDDQLLEKEQRDTGYFDFDPKQNEIKGNFSKSALMVFSTDSALIDPSLISGATGDERQVLVPTTITITWHLFRKKIDAELVLKPKQGYDDWLPNADSTAPLTLDIEITKPKGAKGIIKVKLQNVSKEPGKCLNDPPSNPNKDYDLELAKAPGTTVDFEISDDGQEAKTTEEVSKATIVINPKDYGAFGQVTAEAVVTVNGVKQTVQATCKGGKTEQSFLAVPRDDNQNDIADSWEKQVGAEDAESDAESAPGEPSRIGDGLTVYEEYRGFKANSQHIRTDPNKKDLFVVDQNGLVRYSFAMNGAYGSAMLHLVGSQELQKNSRWINFNHKSHHQVEQCGLIVKAGSLRSGYGEATPPPWLPPESEPGSPKDTEAIIIDKQWIDIWTRSFIRDNKAKLKSVPGGITPQWVAGMVKQVTSLVVTHEIAHGIAVKHHKPMNGGITTCPVKYPMASSGVASILNMMLGKAPWPTKLCTGVDKCMDQIIVSDRS